LILSLRFLKSATNPTGLKFSSADLRSDLGSPRVWKKSRQLVKTNAVSANRRFQFQKRRQLFIRTHNETLSVTVMRVCNEDRSPVGIHG
jgi:hypothetical protein